MDWSVLLNYGLGIAFMVALYFAVHFEHLYYEANLRNDLLVRENEHLQGTIKEIFRHVRSS